MTPLRTREALPMKARRLFLVDRLAGLGAQHAFVLLIHVHRLQTGSNWYPERPLPPSTLRINYMPAPPSCSSYV